jgi:hypothetical protein
MAERSLRDYKEISVVFLVITRDKDIPEDKG